MRFTNFSGCLALMGVTCGVGFGSGACGSDERRAPSGESGSSGAGRGGALPGAAGEVGRGGVGASGGGSLGAQGGSGEGGAAAQGGVGGEPAAAGAAQGGDASGAGGEPPAVDPFPCPSDEQREPDFEASCGLSGSWGDGEQVAVDAALGATLIGISPDELTLVWSEPQTSVTGYFVADRASPSEEFGAAQALAATHVVALGPDGLRLVRLSDDQSALLSVKRTSRGEAFGLAEEGEFALLNADAQARGWGFLGCALAPDDQTLYYSVVAPDEPYPLRVSRRSSDSSWPVGEAVQGCELEAHGGYGRYPTAVSADGRTLFFFDTWRGVARAAWRASADGAFTWFRDLGEIQAPQPNAACDRLYYSAPDASASIFSAAAE